MQPGLLNISPLLLFLESFCSNFLIRGFGHSSFVIRFILFFGIYPCTVHNQSFFVVTWYSHYLHVHFWSIIYVHLYHNVSSVDNIEGVCFWSISKICNNNNDYYSPFHLTWPNFSWWYLQTAGGIGLFGLRPGLVWEAQDAAGCWTVWECANWNIAVYI